MKNLETRKVPASPMSPGNQGHSSTLTAILALVLILVAVALLGLVLRYSVRRLYTHNRSFTLTKVDIDCSSPVLQRLAEEVLKKHGVVPGEVTLPAADIAGVRQELKDDPRVADLRVTRHYPDRIRVAIKDRKAVAVLRFHPRYNRPSLKVDAEGVVLPADADGVTAVLPTVNGLGNPNNYVAGQATSDQGLMAFLEFLKAVQLRPEGNIYEVNIGRLDAKNEVLTLFLNAKGPFKPCAQLVLPTADINVALDRIQQVVELRQEANLTISYLNASYENIPIRP